MLSLSLCHDCHRGSLGLWFNTMADNNRADGQMVMCADVCCVCVCVSACLSVSGEQESMSMKSSSTVKL